MRDLPPSFGDLIGSLGDFIRGDLADSVFARWVSDETLGVPESLPWSLSLSFDLSTGSYKDKNKTAVLYNFLLYNSSDI